MADEDKIHFVTSDDAAEKIKKLQEKLKVDSPGEVISMALSMLELAIGRDVEFSDKKKSLKVSKFSKLNQTVIIEDGDGK